MRLIIGGKGQGKLALLLLEGFFTAEQVTDGATCSFNEICEKPVLNHLHLLVRRWTDSGNSMESLRKQLLNGKLQVILCDEIGSGIVPIHRAEEQWREDTGRLGCELAAKSMVVDRIFCGLKQRIKQEKIRITFIRHGKTQGNLEHRYIGSTDEALCDIGIAELNEKIQQETYPETDALAVSPMLRCRETAQIIYPEIEQQIIVDFRESDFGRYENKNYLELNDDADYQNWLVSNGTLPFPDGERRADFILRCHTAFRDLISQWRNQGIEKAAIVAHGGTIMAILSSVLGGEFYDYQIKNAETYQILL